MKKYIIIPVIVVLVATIFSCSSTPKEFKNACDKYNIYYNKNYMAYILVLKEKPNTGYHIWENEGKYYLKGTKPLNDVLFYGMDYPTLDAALQAAIVKGLDVSIENPDFYKTNTDVSIICN